MVAGELSPDELVTERFTVKLPADEYGCVTFFAVTSVVLNQEVSPNDQFQYLDAGPLRGVIELDTQWRVAGCRRTGKDRDRQGR